MNEARLRVLCGVGPNDPWPSYAWPGGYVVEYVTDDGDVLCADCVNDNSNPVHFGSPLRYGGGDGWGIVAIGTVEDSESDVICAHCGTVMFQSANESEDMQ